MTKTEKWKHLLVKETTFNRFKKSIGNLKLYPETEQALNEYIDRIEAVEDMGKDKDK
jgi:hypothetical protein